VPASKRSHWWRWLYIVHRWVAIVTCLLFAIWFVSGLVMVYVPFPSLSRAERLAGLEPIDWRQVRLQPAEALRAAGVSGPPRAMALEMRAGHPVWRIDPWDSPQTTVSAQDGHPLGKAGMAEAARIAAAFASAPVRAIEPIERDQWTVPGSFDRHRPLWKASLSGPGGRVLYVSSATGAVVLDTNASERFWNWLGSVPHWIYPTVLRQDNAAWRQVVMWVSGPCIVGAVTGMWIGVLRTRLGRRRFKGGRVTPYRGWMEWHHVAGLIGGTFLVAWIFSGWLSVDPFRLFASEGVSEARMQAYAGAAMPGPIDLAALAGRSDGAKRIMLDAAAGRPLVTIERSAEATSVLDARTLAPAAIGRPDLLRAVTSLVPGAPIVAVERLDAPDAYWYAVGERPTLPVLRVRFGDAAGTWVHVDPASGGLLGDLDRRRRVYRWLFDLLHKWDLNVLTLHRPAWDVLLWLLSLLGLVTSVTGIKVGWARLRRRKPVAPA
jgi:uncharacterized iron-regulated membrane protein